MDNKLKSKVGMKVPAGCRGEFESVIRDRDGNLVVRAVTRKTDLFDSYDRFRINYCSTHRKEKIWPSYREGRVDLFTLIYGAWLKAKEERRAKHRP